MKILDDIEKYLNEEEKEDTDGYTEDDDILEKMLDLISSLDPDKLSDEQAKRVTQIIDTLADEGEDDLEEGVAKKRVRIKPEEKRKRRVEYRKKRHKLKIKAKRYRRTSGFKRWKRKTKIKSRSGKTATGKRIRKFI